jgi:hypothetical protein
MAAMLSAKKVLFESDENAKPNQEVWGNCGYLRYS